MAMVNGPAFSFGNYGKNIAGTDAYKRIEPKSIASK